MEECDAARGQQALEPAPVWRAGAEDAHDGEPSAGFEDPVGLPQDACGVAELVKGAAADGARERAVEEREVLRVRPYEGRVRSDRACSPGRFPQHGGGDVYPDDFPTVEPAAQAAGVEACGAAKVEVAAASDRADEACDDLELPLVREGFTGEQA